MRSYSAGKSSLPPQPTNATLRILATRPFISLGNDTGTRQLYIQYFLNYGLPFQPDMEAATTDQILPMIAHNLGIGFYPEKLAQESIAKGEVCQISITEPLPDGAYVCSVTRTVL